MPIMERLICICKKQLLLKIMANLQKYFQTDPFYKDITTLIINTDYGRGKEQITVQDMIFG